MRRLLLYVHYNKHNSLDNHVVYQLEKIRIVYETVVFISNSVISQTDKDKLIGGNLVQYFLQRENAGFDFGGWKDGLVYFGLDKTVQYDSITFMNDTCYGPLWDISSVYRSYEKQDCDFWGITRHPSIYEGNRIIKEHLQSYFIVFQGEVIKSAAFLAFWNDIQDFETIQQTINEGEIYLTQYFLKYGYKFSSLIDELLGEQNIVANISMEFPERLLEARIPFIKVKSFPYKKAVTPHLLKVIKTASDYPINLIVNHQNNLNFPGITHLGLTQTAHLFQEKTQVSKIVITLMNVSGNHCIFEKFITKLTELCCNVELYVDDKEVVDSFKSQGNLQYMSFMNKENIWQVLDKVENVDVIGIFNLEITHKNDSCALLGFEAVRDTLLENLENVVINFKYNPQLGVIFSDLPLISQIRGQKDSIDTDKFRMEWEREDWIKDLPVGEELNLFTPPFQSFWISRDTLSHFSSCKMSPEFIIYMMWAINRDFMLVGNEERIPALLLSKQVSFEERRYTSRDFDTMNFIDKFRFVLRPFVTITKYQIKKSFLIVYHIFKESKK